MDRYRDYRLDYDNKDLVNTTKEQPETTMLIICNKYENIAFPDPFEDAKLADIFQQQAQLSRIDDSEDVIPRLKKDEEFALESMRNSIKLIKDNGKLKYEVGTIWKENEPTFKSNFDYAKRRLDSTLKKKLDNKILFDDYASKINGWLESDYIEKTKFEEPQFFLPHFPVIRQDKTTTKVRPVMDAAAKCGYKGAAKSLNDALLEGPKLINNLVGVLLRFRKKNRINRGLKRDVSSSTAAKERSCLL